MSTSFVLKKPSPKTRTFFYPFHTTRCWTNHLTSAETKISNNLNTNNEDFLEKKKKKNEHRHKLHICGVASTLQKSIASLIKDSDKDTLRHSALKIFDSLRSTSGYLLNNTATNSNIPTWSLAHPNQKLTPHHVAYDPNLILAYLATRLPHHYVAITRVLQEVFKKLPDFHPQSIFDFGTGPGTAIWALRNSLLPWAHSPVTAMDINPHMLEMAKLIAKETLHESSPIEFLEYLPISLEPQFDLTIASFVFSEIENKSIFKKSIESIWNMTKEILVVVDRGTPSGSQRILEIRNTLLHFKNATMIAPVCLYFSSLHSLKHAIVFYFPSKRNR
ncbi:Methyltransferase-like protein 17, mitochondrial [Coelomomyces lativittatus]|nr:Methyltransferase-like protein 17, mitochondrial [Coelomomyces lativittatus]